MNIRQLHVSKLTTLRKQRDQHWADHKPDDGELCIVCEAMNEEVEWREDAITKIDAGMRQLRIVSQ